MSTSMPAPQRSVLQSGRYGLPSLMQSIQLTEHECKRFARNRLAPNVRLVRLPSQPASRPESARVYGEFAFIAPLWDKNHPSNIFLLRHPVQPCSITTDRGDAADVGSPRQDVRTEVTGPSGPHHPSAREAEDRLRTRKPLAHRAPRTSSSVAPQEEG